MHIKFIFINLLGIFNRSGLVGIQSEEDSICREEVSVDLGRNSDQKTEVSKLSHIPIS
jgi:hypothetical protein